ncbi:unnamed protein product [Rhizophagus irregularis]|nr:unnamed protein product [Rhizophagus irregularis]
MLEETGGSDLIFCVSLINSTKQSASVVVLNSNDLTTDFTGPRRVFTASTSVKKDQLRISSEISVLNFSGVSFTILIIKKKLVNEQ